MLRYSKSGVNISTADSWITVETLSSLPVDVNNIMYAESTNPILGIRLYSDKKIQARATKTGSSYGVDAWFVWYY